MAQTSQDLKKGIDISGLTVVTASELIQLVDAGRLADDKGMIIVTTDSALDVPDVPNPAVLLEGVIPTFWERYFWSRRPHASSAVDTKVKTYRWNPQRTAIATYLQWEDIEATANDALVLATEASSDAGTAIARADLAIATAGVANNNANIAITTTGVTSTDLTALTQRTQDSEADIITLFERVATLDTQVEDVVPVSKGGTGGITPIGAANNLGLANTPTDFVFLKEVQAEGVAGGTFTNGAWQIRVLNEKTGTTEDFVTLNGDNTFTLTRGSYLIEIDAPAYAVESHIARLEQLVGAAYVAHTSGSTEKTSSSIAATTKSKVMAVVVIDATFTFKVTHYCTAAGTFGFPANITGQSEIYTQVKITVLGSR